MSEKLIESAPNLVLVLDMKGRIVRINPTIETLTGRSLDDIRGHDWFDSFLPSRIRDETRQVFLMVMSGNLFHGYIGSILAKDGEERKIEWNSAHLTNADGVNIGLLCTGTDVTDRLRLEGEVIAAVEGDRRRIAQELHDGVGSLLTGIIFHLSALKEKIGVNTPPDPTEVESVISLVKDAIGQSRDIAHGIHPIGNAPEELMSALEKLTLRMDTAHPARCRFHCESPVMVGDARVANQLFRISQEALTNAVKHSEAKFITVSLNQDDAAVSVEIVDDGIGFDPESSHSEGLGLHTMRYRAHAISGFLTIKREENQGTKVVCSVPLPALQT